MEKTLYIIMDKNMVCPYAVFIGTSFGKQQISPWDFRRGNAVRYLKAYLLRHSENPALEKWHYISVDNNRKNLLKKVTYVERSN